MAEQEGAPGFSDQQTNGEDTAPQVGVISQYVKDLSFEKLNDEIHEVALKIDVSARADGNVAFAVELVYAGLFALRNIPEEQLQPFLLAEAPRILFPFARQIISGRVLD